MARFKQIFPGKNFSGLFNKDDPIQARHAIEDVQETYDYIYIKVLRDEKLQIMINKLNITDLEGSNFCQLLVSQSIPVLCPVCLCQEHEELKEPVITSCGHLFCWTCLYPSVKESPSQEYNCPSCRLIITSVMTDNSRGIMRTDSERLQSGIPQRPGQGIFPFDFDYGDMVEEHDAGQVVDRRSEGEDLNPEASGESPANSQPTRRSGRERRVNSRLGGYADLSGMPFEPLEQGTSQEETFAEEEEIGEAESRGSGEEEGMDSEDEDSMTSTESYLPEVDVRFIPYNSSNNAAQEISLANAVEEDLDEIARVEFEAENDVIDESEEEFLNQSLSNQTVPGLSGRGISEVNLVPGIYGAAENHLVTEAPTEDLVMNARDNIEQRLNSRYKARDTVEGSQLSHVEVVLLHTRINIREENVKLEALNFTTIGRSVRRDYPNSFPGTAIKEVPKRVKSIILKAKKDFESGKKIVPKILRAGDDRETRMEETVGTILRLSSAAPVTVRHNQNRGTTRRPIVVGRPTLMGPGVGNIAPPSSRTVSPSASASAALDDHNDTDAIDGEAAEDYVQERRLRQEQGANIREHSLGLMPQRRNNNTRLSTQIETINSSIQMLNSTRQSSLPPSGILADISRRADQRVDTREFDVRAREERERARVEERRENRRMDLILVASITKDKEMQDKLSVTGCLKVYKMLPEPNLEADQEISPELPITLSLTRIDQLKRDLMEYLGHVGDYSGIVTKMKNSDKSIVTSVEMISFQQCYISDFTKSGKMYILLTEK